MLIPANEHKHTKVLVTGFGPFGRYDTNPSWEMAKCLDNCILQTSDGSRLEISARHVDVKYSAVLDHVPKFHSESADLIVHLGVGPQHGIKVESRARKFGYDQKDAFGEYAPSTTIAGHMVRGFTLPRYAKCPDVLTMDYASSIVGAISDHDVTLSDDAGLYLCEFISYASLAQGLQSGISAQFVHVPADSDNATVSALKRIIVSLAEQSPA